MNVDLTGGQSDQSRYKTVNGATLDKLSLAVSERMDDGWVCQGSPFFNTAGMVWIQAMVRVVQAPAGEVRLREPKRK